MKIIHGDTGLVVRGRKPSEEFYLTTTEFNTNVGGGSSSIVTDKDIKNTVYPAAYVETNHLLSIVSAPDHIGDSYSITNTTPDICTLSGNEIHWAQDGVGKINVRNGYTTKQIAARVKRTTTASEWHQFSDYSTGSLAAHIRNAMKALVAGKTSSYTTRNLTINAGVARNPSLWCASLDMTPFSFCNTNKPLQAACVISPNHILTCNHWAISNHQWIDSNGVVVTRNISNQTRVGTTDISIGYVTTPFPATLTKAKTLPANYASYLPVKAAVSVETMPVGFIGDLRQGEADSQVGIGRGTIRATTAISEVSVDHNLEAEFADYFHNTPFSSGSPIFVPINGVPVVLGTWFTGDHTNNYNTIGAFEKLYDHIDAINAVMAALHGSAEYQLQTVDLSGFTIY